MAGAPDDAGGPPILPWRFVGGVFLHLVVPAYLLTLLAAAIVLGLGGVDTREALLRAALPVSAGFAIVYGGAALLATLLAGATDPALRRRRARREAEDPRLAVARSARRLAWSLEHGRRLLGAPAVTRIAAVADWNHADPRVQRLSADLAEVVRTAEAALATAAAGARAGIVATVTASLDRIAAAAAGFAADRGRLDRGDVDTLARYLALRYPALDSDSELL